MKLTLCVNCSILQLCYVVAFQYTFLFKFKAHDVVFLMVQNWRETIEHQATGKRLVLRVFVYLYQKDIELYNMYGRSNTLLFRNVGLLCLRCIPRCNCICSRCTFKTVLPVRITPRFVHPQGILCVCDFITSYARAVQYIDHKPHVIWLLSAIYCAQLVSEVRLNDATSSVANIFNGK